MVHLEWRQRGSINVQKYVHYTQRLELLPACLIVTFPRAGEHRGPVSILSEPLVALFGFFFFGGVLMLLERQGRGVTRPLH